MLYDYFWLKIPPQLLPEYSSSIFLLFERTVPVQNKLEIWKSNADEKIQHENLCRRRKYQFYVCVVHETKNLNLKYHLQSHHIRREPFQCEICKVRFTRKCLHHHLKRIHKIKNWWTNYDCDKCINLKHVQHSKNKNSFLKNKSVETWLIVASSRKKNGKIWFHKFDNFFPHSILNLFFDFF